MTTAAMLAVGACATTSSSTAGGGEPPPSGPDVFPGAGAPAPLPSAIPFESLEGPLWLTAQNALVFSDVVEANGPNARIYRYDGATQAIAPLPYPAKGPTSTNGLSVDPSGRLVACERYNGRIVRVELNGTATVLAERWPAEGGKPLNAPNDVVDRSAESRCHLSLRQGLQAYKLGVDEPGLATPVPAGPSAKGLAAIAGIVGLSALRFRTRVMSPVGSLHLLFLH